MAHIKRIIEVELIAQAERIKRLEQIILNIAAGSESSLPDVGEKHTHWVFPLIGSRDLVEEIKGKEQ